MAAPYRPCAKCQMVRIIAFMFTGFLIMSMMIFQPASIVRLASIMPSPMVIGLGIVILGGLEFTRRYIGMKNNRN